MRLSLGSFCASRSSIRLSESTSCRHRRCQAKDSEWSTISATPESSFDAILRAMVAEPDGMPAASSFHQALAEHPPAHQPPPLSALPCSAFNLRDTIRSRCGLQAGRSLPDWTTPALHPARKAHMTRPAEAPVTSETEVESLILQEPSELPPSEFPLQPTADVTGAAAFPKVLRRRLDRFFAEENLSPKADRTMWVKIAAGLAVLAGSWIAIYSFNPDRWKFVALYLLGGLAQTFLLLNIAHDSNHNAISSVAAPSTRPSTTPSTSAESTPTCGASCTIADTTPASMSTARTTRSPAAASSASPRMSPARPLAPLPASLRRSASTRIFSLDYVFVRDFEILLLPHARLPQAHQASRSREYAILFASQGLLLHLHARAAGACSCTNPCWLVLGARSCSCTSSSASRVSLVFQTTHTIDTTYFPHQPQRVRQQRLPHLRHHGRLRHREANRRLARRRPQSPHRTPSVPVRLPYPLRFADPNRARDRLGVWHPYREHPTMTRAIRHHLILLKQLGNESWS